MQLKLPGRDAPPTDLELAPALVPVMALGMTDVPGGLICLDSHTVAYPVGRCMAVYSSEPGRTCVSEARRDVRHITAVTVSQDHKWIAVAEAVTNNQPPQVTLLDVANGLERGVSLSGTGAEDYTSVSFSSDGQLVIASSPLNNQPSTVFHVWDWTTSCDPTSTGTAPGFADKVSVNPRFTSNVFVQCSSAAFYMRLTSGGQYRSFQLEGMNKKPEAHFTDHSWLPDGRMVLAMSDRQLLLVDGVQVQRSITLTGMPSCISCLPDGSVLVALHKGSIDYLKPDTHIASSTLLNYATIKPPSADEVAAGAAPVPGGDLTIKGMSLAPVPVGSMGLGSGRVACYIKGGPVMMLNMRLIKPKHVGEGLAAEQVWDSLLPPPHSAAIVSVSVSMRRDYVATAAEDLTVRVWCWRPMRLVAVHSCHHTPLAVAIDPLGSELVITYIDCVRLYSVVEGMLLEVSSLQLPGEGGRPPEELVRCSRAAWSPTGHLLALVGGPGGKEVLLFSALHRTLVARLRGHFSAVLDIVWSEDGLYLATASEGAVYTWHTEDFSKRQESAVKGCFNSAITCTPDFGTIVTGDASQGMRVLETARAHNSVGDSKLGASRRTSGSPVNSSGVKAIDSIDGSKANKGDVTSLNIAGSYAGVVLPSRGAMAVAVTPTYKCVVGGGLHGAIRVCDLPPTSALHYQEYVPHVSDIMCLVVHHEGRFVITADAKGMWMLHTLVAPQTYQAAVAQHLGSPRRARAMHHHNHHHSTSQLQLTASRNSHQDSMGATGRGAGMAALPPYNMLVAYARPEMGDMRGKQEMHSDVLTVRGSEMTLLKENVKEMRDKLAKAASTTEYKVYEKEQQVRRTMEGDVARLKAEVAALATELRKTKIELAEQAEQAVQDLEMAHMSAQSELEEQKEKFQSMIAVEIERTNLAESELFKIKGKFGRKLDGMQDAQKQLETAANEKVAVLQAHVGSMQEQAVVTLEKAHAKMETEIRIDIELNENEMGRLELQTKQAVEEREDKYMTLLAKHTMQGGITNQALASAEELQKQNEYLRKENLRLSDQAAALQEELHAMHAAWAERDVKQRMTDVEVKELGHQVAQGRLYTQLATSRIAELSNEIEPLKHSKSEAQSQVAKLEALQVRLAERRARQAEQTQALTSALTHAREELAVVKAAASQQTAYWSNFTTQLFRMLHSVPVDKWAGIMGKLHADFITGKDKLDWKKYTDENKDGRGEDALKADQDLTEAELKVQLKEVQAQMMHAQRMLESYQHTREKENVSHKGVIGRLQSENVEMLAQLNIAKRDLKEAQAVIDKLRVDLYQAKHQSSSAQSSTSATPASGVPQGGTAAGGGKSSSRPDSRGGGAMTGGNRGGPGAMGGRPESRGNMGGGGGWGEGRGATSPGHMSTSAATSPRPGVLSGIPEATPAYPDIPPGSAPVGMTRGGRGSPPRIRGMPGAMDRDRGATGPGQGSPGPGGPTETVTGDMPSGGWWLGSNSLFEVPSNLNIIKGLPSGDPGAKRGGGTAPASSEWSGPGSYRTRPGTNEQQGVVRVAGSKVGPGGGAGNFFGHAGRDGHHAHSTLPDASSSPRQQGFTPATPAIPTNPRLVFSPPTTAFSTHSPPLAPQQQSGAGISISWEAGPGTGSGTPPLSSSRQSSLASQRQQMPIATTTAAAPSASGSFSHRESTRSTASNAAAGAADASGAAPTLMPTSAANSFTRRESVRSAGSNQDADGVGAGVIPESPSRSFSQGSYQPLMTGDDDLDPITSRPGSSSQRPPQQQSSSRNGSRQTSAQSSVSAVREGGGVAAASVGSGSVRASRVGEESVGQETETDPADAAPRGSSAVSTSSQQPGAGDIGGGGGGGSVAASGPPSRINSIAASNSSFRRESESVNRPGSEPQVGTPGSAWEGYREHLGPSTSFNPPSQTDPSQQQQQPPLLYSHSSHSNSSLASPSQQPTGSYAGLVPPATAPAGPGNRPLMSRSSSLVYSPPGTAPGGTASPTAIPPRPGTSNYPPIQHHTGFTGTQPPPGHMGLPSAFQTQNIASSGTPEDHHVHMSLNNDVDGGQQPGTPPLTGQLAAAARAAAAARSVSLSPGFLTTLAGGVARPGPTKLTTMGAGFRSFAPRGGTPADPRGGAARR